MFNRLILVLFMMCGFGISAVQAESEFTVFGGIQSAPHSRVTVQGDGIDDNFLSAWEGRSLEMPPYYGVRYTYWRDSNWGFALNFVHTKVYSSDETRTTNGYAVMEFTDGMNPLTVDVIYRSSQKFAGFQPYAGIGFGISIPHVELQKSGHPLTFEYQYGGPVALALGGLKYAINDNWSVLMEYQFHHYWVNVSMDPSATFESNIITNALNLGVSYTW